MPSKQEKKDKVAAVKNISQKIGVFVLRWFYLVMLLAATAYSIFVWNKYIVNAEWSEEKKKAYIAEQSVFSFDRKTYDKALGLAKSREEKYKTGAGNIARDIFFPEGF